DAVAGRAEIVVDGGFSRGTDVVKALARGAKMVAIGRTILWGLAADGAAGVARAFEILREEVRTTMGLCGRTRIADLTPDLIFRAGGGAPRLLHATARCPATRPAGSRA